MADQSIGLMEGAFFVSKGEILSWVNSTLEVFYLIQTIK